MTTGTTELYAYGPDVDVDAQAVRERSSDDRDP